MGSLGGKTVYTMLNCKDGFWRSELDDENFEMYVRLTIQSETCYSQIEKELWAITYAFKKFHYLVYGHVLIVQSDHKHLQYIVKKDIAKTTTRLQLCYSSY